MFIKHAVIADAVVAGGGGKWNIIGTFNTIFAPDFPVKHPRLGLWLRIEAHDREAGKHTLRVDFVDGTGKKLVRLPEMKFTLQREGVLEGTPLSMQVGLEINTISIPDPGNYDFAIRVDGTYLDSVPLYVRKVQKPQSS